MISSIVRQQLLAKKKKKKPKEKELHIIVHRDVSFLWFDSQKKKKKSADLPNFLD